MERRKHIRYHVEYAGSFSGEKIRANNVILDLSLSGCRARSKIMVAEGDVLGVLIDVPRFEAPLHVDLAEIRWAQGQEFGMEFIRMAPGHQERLRDLIQKTEAERTS